MAPRKPTVVLVYLFRDDSPHVADTDIGGDTTPWRLLTGRYWPPPPEAVLAVVPFGSLTTLYPPSGESRRPLPACIVYGDAAELGSAVTYGAVDFLKEPWDATELEFRVERALGNQSLLQGTLKETAGLAEGGVTLTEAEERLFRALWVERGRTVSREALGYVVGCDIKGRAIDMAVSRLRAKLYHSTETIHIRAVRRHGYRLERERPDGHCG